MDTEEIRGWFVGRIPDGWFQAPPDVSIDGDEVLVVGALADVDSGEGAGEATRQAARAGRAKQLREDTREARMRIAREAEHRFGRKVSWGVEVGGERFLFTTMAVPVMTRLRMDERRVLDTLIEAGVARSRSHALAWCVRLVADRQAEWLKDLEEALTAVQRVRTQGPTRGSTSR